MFNEWQETASSDPGVRGQNLAFCDHFHSQWNEMHFLISLKIDHTQDTAEDIAPKNY